MRARGSGKSRTTYTVVRADYPTPLPFELHIADQGTFIRLGKSLFGLRDVEVGDEAFDRAVRVKTGDEGCRQSRACEPRRESRDPRHDRAVKGSVRDQTRFATLGTAGSLRFDPGGGCCAVMAALVPVTRMLGSA